jgi:predicted nucleotidyltransferase
MELASYFKKYIEICREIKKRLLEIIDVKIYVFGSVVKGDFSIGLSDIDVAIVSDEFNDREKKLKIYDFLFNKYFSSPFEFHLLTENQWSFYRSFIDKYIEL